MTPAHCGKPLRAARLAAAGVATVFTLMGCAVVPSVPGEAERPSAVAVSPATTPATTPVSIPSFDRGPQGQPWMLIGHWSPATATSPVGAVVLLHGCSGPYDGGQRLSSRMLTYTAWLNARGWSVLILDSLTPRGERELCTQRLGTRAVTQANRRLDAWAGLAWLARQPGVDASRLGLIGWSNGGSTVLAALQADRLRNRPSGVPMPAFGVAYYPGCMDAQRQAMVPAAPLLLQVGREDDWTPAQPCIDWVADLHQRGVRDERTLALAVYPGAYHGFDGTSPLRLRTDVPNGTRPGQGVHNGAHPPSREAAFTRLEDWLARYTSKLTP